MKLTKEKMKQEIKKNYSLKQLWSINDIERLYDKKQGGYFFSKNTMRFFSSRVLSDFFVGKNKAYFVTSERKCFNDYNRAFTVREIDLNSGDINTVGEFLEYSSKAVAMTNALKLAYENETKGA